MCTIRAKAHTDQKQHTNNFLASQQFMQTIKKICFIRQQNNQTFYWNNNTI